MSWRCHAASRTTLTSRIETSRYHRRICQARLPTLHDPHWRALITKTITRSCILLCTILRFDDVYIVHKQISLPSEGTLTLNRMSRAPYMHRRQLWLQWTLICCDKLRPHMLVFSYTLLIYWRCLQDNPTLIYFVVLATWYILTNLKLAMWPYTIIEIRIRCILINNIVVDGKGLQSNCCVSIVDDCTHNFRTIVILLL